MRGQDPKVENHWSMGWVKQIYRNHWCTLTKKNTSQEKTKFFFLLVHFWLKVSKVVSVLPWGLQSVEREDSQQQKGQWASAWQQVGPLPTEQQVNSLLPLSMRAESSLLSGMSKGRNPSLAKDFSGHTASDNCTSLLPVHSCLTSLCKHWSFTSYLLI